ncbi:hypothetical protein LTR70_009691 [Exophiala xenobiotica]|uniref:Uncharacterized protein n=1 Tax=Lithohypha guttulata TaxID=1690604 RepID=A0ABR0JYG3_9EURO|nr:hypothetical protein LTR24_009567 [Lithohypha guttulata]KAK5310156.1 hypothetical protein LTR70_009691 [Exophiala xenobiotica]
MEDRSIHTSRSAQETAVRSHFQALYDFIKETGFSVVNQQVVNSKTSDTDMDTEMEEIDADREDSGAPSTPVKRKPGRPRKSESKRAKPLKLSGRGVTLKEGTSRTGPE